MTSYKLMFFRLNSIKIAFTTLLFPVVLCFSATPSLSLTVSDAHLTQAKLSNLIAQTKQSQKQRRIALVMGNANYNEGKLANPLNDAEDMAKALQEVGFEVILVKNASLRQMNEALEKFNKKLLSGEVGLFYYAGHGMQVAGENYLIPVDAEINREQDVKYAALAVGRIQGAMEDAKTRTNIIILDACRNNPYSRKWRSASKSGGLAALEATTGTFIAYATAPEKTAEDGSGRNGIYTAHILKEIKTPNLDIELMFKRVRQGVVEETNGEQTPWDSSSLIDSFAFNRTGSNTTGTTTIKPQTNPPPIATNSGVKPPIRRPPLDSTPQNNEIALGYFNRGNEYYDSKDYQRAIAEYTQAVKSDPQYALAYYNRGLAYYNLKQSDKAIADYTQAIQINPQYADAYNNRGLAYHDLQQYEKAIADYTKAIQFKPEYALAYYNRGLAYYDLQQYDQAIPNYTQAIQFNPQDVDAYNNRGLVYYSLRQYDKALADYTQALALNPNYTLAYYNRGNTYYELKQYEKALSDYNRAIALNPKYASAYIGRGNTYDDLKQSEKAIADYNQAIALNPKYASAYYNRGITYKNLKQYEKAIADYTQAIALNPNYAQAYNNRGISYENLKQYEKARADWEKAAELYTQQGYPENAQRVRQWIEKLPKYP